MAEKDNQLDRIEKKVDRTLIIVRAIGFYSLLVAFALLYYIFNHWMEKLDANVNRGQRVYKWTCFKHNSMVCVCSAFSYYCIARDYCL